MSEPSPATSGSGSARVALWAGLTALALAHASIPATAQDRVGQRDPVARADAARTAPDPLAVRPSRSDYQPASAGAAPEIQPELRDDASPGFGQAGFAAPAGPASEADPADLAGPLEADDTYAEFGMWPDQPFPAEAPVSTLPGPADDDLDVGRVEPLIDIDRPVAAGRESRRVEALGIAGRVPADDPYAPLGMRFGNILVTTTLDQWVGASTNPDLSSEGGDAVVSETTLRFNALADTSRYRAFADAYGTFRKSISGEEVDEEEIGASGRVEFDLARGFVARTALSYVRRPESASSPVVLGDTTNRPVRQTLAGSASLAKEVGKARLAVEAEVERSWFGDAELTDGGTLSQEDRDFTLGTVVLRGGFEVSPALTPFAEVEFGRRFQAEQRDAQGYERSSYRYAARIGTAFDLGEKFAGEVSVGWLHEDLDDDRLDPISGATVAANVAWSPQRGTVLSLIATTAVEGTTTASESGSVIYSATAEFRREMRSNLTATASLGGYFRDYAAVDQSDTGLIAEAGLIYWLNRNVALTTRTRYELLTSTLPGREADAFGVFAGVRLQR